MATHFILVIENGFTEMAEAAQLLCRHIIRYPYCMRRPGRKKKALLVPWENIFLLVLKSLLIINRIGRRDLD